MRIRSIARFALACSCLSLATGWAWADIQLGVVSTAPTRPHFVAAGTATSFVVSARNTGVAPASVSLAIRSVGSPGDWQGLLFSADSLFRPVGTGSDQTVVTIPAQQALQLEHDNGPAEGHTKVHENAHQGRRGTAVERLWAEQRAGDSLKEARHR